MSLNTQYGIIGVLLGTVLLTACPTGIGFFPNGGNEPEFFVGGNGAQGTSGNVVMQVEDPVWYAREVGTSEWQEIQGTSVSFPYEVEIIVRSATPDTFILYETGRFTERLGEQLSSPNLPVSNSPIFNENTPLTLTQSQITETYTAIAIHRSHSSSNYASVVITINTDSVVGGE